jgi:hypothetical protein
LLFSGTRLPPEVLYQVWFFLLFCDMIKILLGLLLVATIFTACSKSGTISNAGIIGKWNLVSQHNVFVDSLSFHITPVVRDTTYPYHLDITEFNADDTVWFYYVGNDTTKDTYKITGDTLREYVGQILVQTFNYKIDGDSLTLSSFYSSPGNSSDAATFKYGR